MNAELRKRADKQNTNQLNPLSKLREPKIFACGEKALCCIPLTALNRLISEP